MNKERGFRKTGKKGQMMVEYAVMFTVIVTVIIYAAVTYFKPAVNNFFKVSGDIINQATERVQNNF